MIFESILPPHFTKIDDLTRSDYYYLEDTDNCYFLGEYTAEQGYAYSKTNSLILNFKKSLDRKKSPDWPHKERAIRQVATAFRVALTQNQLEQLTFVPIPPSKAKKHPLYDDRLTKMLYTIRPDHPLDIREIIIQQRSYKAAHETKKRPTPQQYQERYDVDNSLLTPIPNYIAIVDDVLTTGAHFQAMETVLSRCFPKAKIVGLFIARRVFELPSV